MTADAAAPRSAAHAVGDGAPPPETPPDTPPDTPSEPSPPSTRRLLLAYARPQASRLLAGALLSLATGATGLLLPLVAKRLVEDLGAGRPVGGPLTLMTVLVVANAAIGALGYYVLSRAAASVVLRARRGLVSHLLRLRISALDRNEPGDLMSRVTSDTTLLRTVISQSLVGGCTGALTLVATVVMMALTDAVLLAVTLAVMALAAVVIGVLVPRINRASRRAQDTVGAMGAALERTLGALRTVKAAGAEHREETALHQVARDSWRAGIDAARWGALAGNTSGLAIQVAFLTVLAVGGARVASGAVGISTLIAFLMYVFYLMAPLQEVVGAITQYSSGAAAVARIRQALELPTEPLPAPAPDGPAPAGALDGPAARPTAVRAPAPRAVGPAPAGLVFERVRFRYRPELPEVLHGVDLTVPPLGMTAFVGPSGAGKSTLLALVERFYDPTAGRVLLDGRDLRDWDLARLRAAIGYVEQDAPVLSGSLRDNLLLGAPEADEEELRRVLRTARLQALVDRLPQGLDTLVGHRGTRLSGGERQRVAIARALLRRPRLLLLDEATSQLDAVNEAALREAVAAAARQTTVLAVAHRLSTVTMADQIVVMEAGRVRATGRHDRLVRTDPLYAELAATQLLVSDG